MSEPTKGPEFIHVERLLEAPVIYFPDPPPLFRRPKQIVNTGKTNPAGVNRRAECRLEPLSRLSDFPRTFCPGSPSLHSLPWHLH